MSAPKGYKARSRHAGGNSRRRIRPWRAILAFLLLIAIAAAAGCLLILSGQR
jgi:hypothetical protein